MVMPWLGPMGKPFFSKVALPLSHLPDLFILVIENYVLKDAEVEHANLGVAMEEIGYLAYEPQHAGTSHFQSHVTHIQVFFFFLTTIY